MTTINHQDMKKLLSILVITALTMHLIFSCSEKDDFVPQLKLSDSTLVLPAEANSTDTFSIISNTDWNITSSADWLTVNPAYGSKNKTVIITVSQNPDSVSRKAELTISSKDLPSKTITITQSGAFSFSMTSLTLDSSANSKGTFNIYSKTSWTLSSSETWLTINPTSGTNNGTVTVTAQQNLDTASRKAIITAAIKGVNPQAITVIQKGSRYSITVSSATITVGADNNSTASFNIVSNTDWSITCSSAWLKISPASGSKNATVTVTAAKTTISKTRTAKVVISAPLATSPSLTVKVNQTGYPCSTDDEKPCDVSGCTVPAMPSYASLTSNAYLPDPFTFMNGKRMTTKEEWTCRRAEIAALAEEFEYGHKPCTPYSATTGSFNNNTITVTVTGNEKTISFNCQIIYPTNGTAPYPAVIGIGFSSLDNTLLSNLGVAVIIFPNNDIAQQDNSSSRGIGKFYDFFCGNHSAGALMAWSWGVSRLIDAIEKTPAANIDPTRLAVTGCSRNGKGALCAGAFDERIVLTIPQESGSGGAASWRVSDYQMNSGTSVQTLSEIVGENCWFRQNFSQFSSTANKLPFDHHMIEALCAPRALLVIENTAMIWLGNLSTWTTANAAHKVWEALGVPDKMGFSQVGHSDHCVFQSSQQPELSAYIKKFLIGTGTDDTNIMKTDGSITFDSTKWVNWTVPTLQ
jgi:hypothetical protein